jgi:hypothetical protein
VSQITNEGSNYGWGLPPSATVSRQRTNKLGEALKFAKSELFRNLPLQLHQMAIAPKAPLPSTFC